jgi:hypothetical protein
MVLPMLPWTVSSVELVLPARPRTLDSGIVGVVHYLLPKKESCCRDGLPVLQWSVSSCSDRSFCTPKDNQLLYRGDGPSCPSINSELL